MATEYGSLDFPEQIAFFRDKGLVPTHRWDDLWQAAHDRGFMVAGAQSADLLADLQAAVRKGIEQGTTPAIFRRDFERIVQKHGWTGWTGEGSEAGRAWRARVIYETNLRASYAAGRYQQLQETKRQRPYWRYRHNDSVLHPRPHHQAINGMILPADHAFWQTAYPPNGFGCRCFVESVSAREMKRNGWSVGTAPADFQPDRGWTYAPGASVYDEMSAMLTQKAANWPKQLAQSFLQSVIVRLSPGSWWGRVVDLARSILGRLR